MFTDLQNLNQVEMISDSNCQVTSMLRTFENCVDFYNFTIVGFGADNLRSMKKLFYNTRLYFFKLQIKI